MITWWQWFGREIGAVRSGQLCFECNICDHRCMQTLAAIHRESPPCPRCGATLRHRALIRLLALHCFGRSLALPSFPRRADLRGAGMSDWEGFASPLAQRLSYTNTYYHQEPRLDILNIPADWMGTLDFLLSSDVLEHVVAPVARAFVNARRLLKPGGVFILTVPWVPEGETREHFPELHDYEILEPGTPGAVLRNRTRDGRVQEFRELVFHGGAGATLELRVFSRAGLLRDLEQAGFENIRIHDEPDLPHGIHWADPWSLPITAQAPR